jgi:4'-phosphopantetheinyl transferase
MSGRATVTVSIWPLAASAARLAVFRTGLSVDEQDRANKFKHEPAAREFIIGRGMTKELLALACGRPQATIVLAAGFRGKPYLVNPPSRLAFNLSHSGGYCALAVGAVKAIGVDIEALRDTVGDLAKNVFTEREAAAYAAVAPADRRRVFFRGWVAKEAYLKATGQGLAGGLKSLELDLSAVPEIRPLAIEGDAEATQAWHFEGFDVAGSIAGAVAIATGDREIEVRINYIHPG